MIPMVDVRQQQQLLKSEIEPKILAALDNSQFILGPNVTAFEQEAADYLGVKHAIGVANGTDALHLALLAAGVGGNDEVITTAFTFIATAEAISYTGAKIRFADIDNKTFNLDLAAVERLINPKTKAILAVHLFGQPAAIIALKALCDKHNIVLIEDCAQSFGATVEGLQTGSFGLAGCFSFFPSKNLSCYGDGGLLTTDDDDFAADVKSLRNHGSKIRYQHHKIGYNSRLDELQAVVLRVKLKHLDGFNKNRQKAAHNYSTSLKNLDIITPFEDQIGSHIYHQYTILSDKRDEIIEALSKNNIASAIYYPIPLHQQEVYREQTRNLSLPIAEDVSKKCLSLPIFPELTDAQIEQIITTIKTLY